ncbi:MAG: hypothetical protein AAF191_10255 [Verrucomicrobiota bacterium]
MDEVFPPSGCSSHCRDWGKLRIGLTTFLLGALITWGVWVTRHIYENPVDQEKVESILKEESIIDRSALELIAKSIVEEARNERLREQQAASDILAGKFEDLFREVRQIQTNVTSVTHNLERSVLSEEEIVRLVQANPSPVYDQRLASMDRRLEEFEDANQEMQQALAEIRGSLSSISTTLENGRRRPWLLSLR